MIQLTINSYELVAMAAKKFKANRGFVNENNS